VQATTQLDDEMSVVADYLFVKLRTHFEGDGIQDT
jgi:hypothetical protein